MKQMNNKATPLIITLLVTAVLPLLGMKTENLTTVVVEVLKHRSTREGLDASQSLDRISNAINNTSCKINDTDCQKRTSLQLTAGDYEVMKKLLELGANVNAHENGTEPIIILAARKGMAASALDNPLKAGAKDQCVTLLLNHKAETPTDISGPFSGPIKKYIQGAQDALDKQKPTTSS